ncbi:MAG: cytochrome c oxidase subunit II [Alphaproteobacteria bacterium]
MRIVLSILSFMMLTTAALAEVTGTVHPGGFPMPNGPVAQNATDLYNFIFWIITAVFVVVMVPILVIIFRFRRSVNKKPATFSHSTAVELAWTIIPALICAVITWKAYASMVFHRTMPENGLAVEVVAYQFGWDFFYPDMGEKGTHVAAAEATAANPVISIPAQNLERQTKALVVPVGVPIKLLVTAQDVIHAFFAPAVGIKIDAMPGRINYTWFQADQTGEFLGQCAELCGSAHGEMFFTVKVVTAEEFAAYINQQRAAAGLAPLETAAVTERLS